MYFTVIFLFGHICIFPSESCLISPVMAITIFLFLVHNYCLLLVCELENDFVSTMDFLLYMKVLEAHNCSVWM